MIAQSYLRRSNKIQLGCLFGLVGLNLATNILRTYYSIDPTMMHFAHLNAPWFTLQGTLAVIICALPRYGSQLTRKKPRKQDEFRVVNNPNAAIAGISSVELTKLDTDEKKGVDMLAPPRAIKVRDDLRQNTESMFPGDSDQLFQHSVAIWSD